MEFPARSLLPWTVLRPLSWPALSAITVLFASGVPSTGAPPDRDIPPYMARSDAPLYTDYFNRDFPFFEATLDLRSDDHPRNVVSRAIILPLAHDTFVAFDTELLRVAAIWQGDYPTLRHLAMTSYNNPLQKSGGGFGGISQPQGEFLYQSGVWAGWQTGTKPAFNDPRPSGEDPRELGRGPLSYGRFIGTKSSATQTKIHYEVAGREIRESFAAVSRDGEVTVRRTLTVAADQTPLLLVNGGDVREHIRVRPTSKTRSMQISYTARGVSINTDFEPKNSSSAASTRFWPKTATSSFVPGAPQGAFAVDELTIPYPNPWERRIRPADIAFNAAGDAWVVTFDGDVYHLQGLDSDEGVVSWRRVAAGFNEPMSIVHRDGATYVLSRNGITELVDENGDGETDHYRLFSNAFVQSPSGRGFVFSLEGLSDGGFLVSTGGQQIDARSPHAGRVLRISPDGEKVTVVATGLRNPWITVDPNSGQIFASDQQGHWVPSTPFHVVEPGKFYGHDESSPGEDAEITPARLWFPYLMAQSGVGMVMGFDERAGPLQDQCLYIEYKTPGGLLVNIPGPDDAQTSAIPLPVKFEVPLLKGEINPADGQTYLVGFQIWDSFAPRLEGISRLRAIKPNLPGPRTAEPFSDGILLTYDRLPTDPLFEVRAWNYQRTKNYGSPQFKMNGEPGFENLTVHSILSSEEEQTLFLAIEDMPMAMTIVVTEIDDGETTEVYTTANALPTITLAEHGLPTTDLAALFKTPVTALQPSAATNVVSVGRGQTLSVQFGCVGCHSIDGSKDGKTGPSWYRLAGRKRKLIDGSFVIADQDYLREAIIDPTAKVPDGYNDPDAGMPPYLGILSDADLESLVLYIDSLR
ncbi:MAG: hypothetical protein SynsKO_22040 [Synoicihabitans sp.]